MRLKRKISLTIDEDVFQAIENAAKYYNMAKSQIAQKAFQLWLKKETEALMAKGYEEMAGEDMAFSDTTLEGQREILS